MMEWTETARHALDEYCARAKASLEGTGADAAEVIDDLRRHVQEEVRASRLTVVTEEDIRRILARVGEPESAGAPNPSPAHKAEVVSPPPASPEKKRPGYFLLVLGVLLPLATLVFELVTGVSAGLLFDPLPTWFHVGAVALVPTANFWIWRAGRARDSRQVKWLGWLNGAAQGVCLYYAMLYLPFAPFAVIGLIYFLLGLIPLAPYAGLLATPWLRLAYCRQTAQTRLPGVWLGTLASFGLLVLFQWPTAVTHHGLANATSNDPSTRLDGVRLLRAFGDQELLLRACYGLLRREVDFNLVRYLAGGNEIVSTDQAREIYYRVTGRPFNSVPPPLLYTKQGRWAALDEELAWDDALGGETVAGQVKGLSLSSSRMDAVAEPNASLVYCEWTLEFKNVSRQPREARAQIALPPGAVVSRVTLWINGEEREAAFGGRSQVREAYREVAVVKRRDPVLVTTCGPDRVLMQCFPVPPDGGVMKVRVGMTAPLMLESLDVGRFVWPRFLERNFRVGADLKHALWIESPAPLTREAAGPTSNPAAARPFTTHESVSDTELACLPRTVEIHRSAEAGIVWTPADEPGAIIRQTIQAAPSVMPSRLVIVLDGSEGMQSCAGHLAEMLSKIPEATEIAVLMASDERGAFIAKPQKATPTVIKQIQQNLGKVRCVGGQDNLPALEAAWDLAAAVEDGAVVWIHQPQPVLLSSESGLRQRIERTSVPTRLLELQIRNGPDRIIEKLDGLAAVEQVMRLGSLQSDFERLLSCWQGRIQVFQLVRERIPSATDGTAGTLVSRHIERLWARDEARRLASQRRRDEAVKLAVDRQLVTPLTGAVVLETREQYDRHNLKPADPMTVPAIPEPGTLNLVGVGIVAWALRRLRRKPQRMRGTGGTS